MSGSFKNKSKLYIYPRCLWFPLWRQCCVEVATEMKTSVDKSNTEHESILVHVFNSPALLSVCMSFVSLLLFSCLSLRAPPFGRAGVSVEDLGRISGRGGYVVCAEAARVGLVPEEGAVTANPLWPQQCHEWGKLRYGTWQDVGDLQLNKWSQFAVVYYGEFVT